jgi:hypothetical protein
MGRLRCVSPSNASDIGDTYLRDMSPFSELVRPGRQAEEHAAGQFID